MTIDEAIEILEKQLTNIGHLFGSSVCDALKLSIEALELLSKLRRHDIEPACETLEGETEK